MQIGEWTKQLGLSLNVTDVTTLADTPLVDVRDYVGDLVNKTLRVVTILVSHSSLCYYRFLTYMYLLSNHACNS